MPTLHSKRGFTLIELMVAITILGIISAIGLVAYSKAQAIARDGRRKQDLRALQQALELYYQQNQSYPVSTSCSNWWCYSNGADPWIPGLTTTYINRMPTDPSGNGGQPWQDNQFGYAYWAGDSSLYGAPCPGTAGQYYALVAQLENHSDPDRNQTKNYKWCDGKSLLPTNEGGTYNWSNWSFVITSQ